MPNSDISNKTCAVYIPGKGTITTTKAEADHLMAEHIKECQSGTRRSAQMHLPSPAETRMPAHVPLRAQVMGVYPTLDSLQGAIDLAKSKLPITSENDLMAILMTYHNSLLAQVAANHKG